MLTKLIKGKGSSVKIESLHSDGAQFLNTYMKTICKPFDKFIAA